MKTIKEVLMEANRYDDVICILRNIIADEHESYAVSVFFDNEGQVKWNVDGCNVRLEAYKLLRLIDEDKCIDEDICLNSISLYTNTIANMMLHNYAVSLSHREVPYIDMDAIRSWMILDNLISCWNLDLESEGSEWDIPEGWKRISKN